MRQLLAFASFELRSRLRQPAVWLFLAIFALLTFGATTSDAIIIGGSSGQTAINSPYVIVQMLSLMSAIGVLIVTAFVATAITRDYELGTWPLFFTKPISRGALLGGRFIGSIVLSAIVMMGAVLGMMVGVFMPWLDPERLMPFTFAPYAWAFVWMVLPNLVVTGALFFAVGTLTRRVLYAYVAAAGFFVVYLVSQSFISDLDNDSIAALSDPFGLSTIALVTRYWTPAERNSALPELGGLLLANRGLWLAVGALAFGWTLRRFRLTTPVERRWPWAREPKPDDAAGHLDVALPTVRLHFGLGPSLQQLAVQTAVELRGIVRSAPFLVLQMFAIVNVVGGAYGSLDQMFGTPVHPVTHLMLRVIDGSSGLFLAIIVTFYAGELIWRERRVRLAEVYDAMPVAQWVPLVAKTVALVGAVALLLGNAMVSAMGVQAVRGYTNFELPLYVNDLFGLSLSRWALVCVLAVVAQVVVNHKYLGFFVVILFWISQIVLPALDLDHGLYRYADAPDTPYSDMNGYGHFIAPAMWYRLYWWGWAAILLVVASLFWVRGTDTGLRQRTKAARGRVTRASTFLLAVAALVTGGSGSWIFFNTVVLNDYVPGDEREEQAVTYEQKYKQYENDPQPSVVAVDLDVGIWPTERKLETSGRIVLENKSGAAVEVLHVRIDPDARIERLSLPDDGIQIDDRELGWRTYRLSPPLAAGARLDVDFALVFDNPGFVNGGSNTNIVHNGTFVDSGRYVPHFGYDPSGEMSDPNDRRKHELPERPRMKPLDDPHGRDHTYLGNEGDWIDFRATVCTSPDQIALAPGYLQREWQEDGRRCFDYAMDSKILNFYAFLSADYTVARDRWNDVAIEVYYHAPHDYNVQRMIDAVKASLEYFTPNFSPYQHRQVRIVEFPRYASFAQAFPNTIPYSESIGFIADLTDPDSIDYVFYVTAHEVAHQWWAHQVIGADVQGSTVLSETLAQYSALMVMEKAYGKRKMHEFLRYELDRYLFGRATEVEKELPLLMVENQPYVHYNKGSLAMYAMRHYVGEDAVNRALRTILEQHAFQGAPFPTSRVLVAALRDVTPPDYAYLVEDLFETITLYDNRMLSAKVTELPDGRFRVDMTVESHKLRADERGAETEIDENDWIEIGVLPAEDEAAHPLAYYSERHRLRSGKTELSFVVDRRPARAGIDPNVILVDRDPDDNERAVE